MAKCAWCGQRKPIYKSGYCQDCYEDIRDGIKENKDQLAQLLQASQSAGDAGDADKNDIAQKTAECAQHLAGYKARKVPFFTSDFRSMVEEIYKNIGIDPALEVEQPKQQSAKVPMSTVRLLQVTCVALAACLAVAVPFLGQVSSQNKELENQIIQLQAERVDLISQLDAAKKTTTAHKTVTLENGHFVAGTDFAAGKYDIEAVSGRGNVYTDSFTGGINAIMGVRSADPQGMAEQKYSNISLDEGVTISVSDVKIRMTLVEAY